MTGLLSDGEVVVVTSSFRSSRSQRLIEKHLMARKQLSVLDGDGEGVLDKDVWNGRG